MRSDCSTPRRAPRRRLVLPLALLAVVTLSGACSDNQPEGPAISGNNPAEVTVPTLPPTTLETTTTVGTSTTVAP